MTETKFPIGSQWKTRGGWRAVVVKINETFLIVWHDGISPQAHDLDGIVVNLNEDLGDLLEPWTDPKTIDVDVKLYFNENGSFVMFRDIGLGRPSNVFAAVHIKQTLREREGL